MGVRDTVRGLGCMAKGVGCLLAIGLALALLGYALLSAITYIVAFVDSHWETMFAVMWAVVGIVGAGVAIIVVLAIANAVGKNSG